METTVARKPNLRVCLNFVFEKENDGFLSETRQILLPIYRNEAGCVGEKSNESRKSGAAKNTLPILGIIVEVQFLNIL